MKRSHARLDKLIHSFSQQTEEEQILFTNPEIYKSLFQQEVNNIKGYLQKKSLTLKNENTLGVLVQQYQLQIAIWLNEVYYAETPKMRQGSKWVTGFIADELHGVLKFIYSRFGQFFKSDEKVPVLSLKQICDMLKGRVQKLRSSLLKEFPDKTHVELALLPLKELLEPRSQTPISYRFFLYTQRVEKVLATYRRSSFSNCDYEDKPILELMVLLNYNSLEACNFITNKITTEIKRVSSEREKIEVLIFYLKEFKQLKERRHFAYRSNFPSLKQQVENWISEEISYHDHLAKMLLNEGAGGEKPVIKGRKIPITLPVDVTGLIFRAAYDTEIFSFKYKTEMFKYISENFSTKNAQELKWNSLSNKSYDAKLNAKRKAIDVLHGFIKKINEY